MMLAVVVCSSVAVNEVLIAEPMFCLCVCLSVCLCVCMYVCVCVDVVSQAICLSASEYQCDSGQCISVNDVCDAVHQCADHSDELNCRMCLSLSLYLSVSLALECPKRSKVKVTVLRQVMYHNFQVKGYLNFKIGRITERKKCFLNNKHSKADGQS